MNRDVKSQVDSSGRVVRVGSFDSSSGDEETLLRDVTRHLPDVQFVDFF